MQENTDIYGSMKQILELKSNQGRSGEMYDPAMDFYDNSKFAFAYDYGYGLSRYMGYDVMVTLYVGIVNERFENRVQGREEYNNKKYVFAITAKYVLFML